MRKEYPKIPEMEANMLYVALEYPEAPISDMNNNPNPSPVDYDSRLMPWTFMVTHEKDGQLFISRYAIDRRPDAAAVFPGIFQQCISNNLLLESGCIIEKSVAEFTQRGYYFPRLMFLVKIQRARTQFFESALSNGSWIPDSNAPDARLTYLWAQSVLECTGSRVSSVKNAVRTSLRRYREVYPGSFDWNPERCIPIYDV
ncbi:hypothetical protein GGR55DRAFT_679372 [Xylaria sp. FL0064]|nr:hypothetical protein GGR55DRAFT_679372 [Xylaria sp. FL0064]